MPDHRPCLALDFDGVICKSDREVFTVALRAYDAMSTGTGFGAEVSRKVAGGDTSLFDRFEELTPLGNRAEDFGVALRSVEREIAIPDQATYDAFFAAQSEAWREAFHRTFYEQRCALREEDYAAWLALHSPYDRISALLHAHADDTTLAVTTSKDGLSVRLLLDDFGLRALFPDALIVDKEHGADKSVHLQVVHGVTGCPFEDMTFVDDKVGHLERVRHLGVRPVLAGWGFNGEREHRLARDLGFAVAFFDTAENELFTPGAP